MERGGGEARQRVSRFESRPADSDGYRAVGTSNRRDDDSLSLSLPPLPPPPRIGKSLRIGSILLK